MSLTEAQIEAVADGLRQAGFNLPDDMTADEIAKFVESVLDALGIEWAT